MSRIPAFAAVGIAVLFGLSACGGGGGKGPKKGPEKSAFTQINQLGVSMKIPQSFPKAGGGKDSVTYTLSDGSGMISIERIALVEGAGLEEYYNKEFESRRKETIKRKKSDDAYRIFKKNEITIGGKKALEVEQEFYAGAGTQKAHNIVVLVDLGDSKILTVTWEASDISTLSWPKAHSTYFKESRESLSLN